MNGKSPKRRWFQYSLKTLFITITLVSLAMGLLFVSPAQRQRAAVQRIHQLGGSYWYAKTTTRESWLVRQLRKWLPRDFFDTVAGVNLYATLTKDADLSYLQVLVEIQQLDLIGTKVTDSGLVYLRGCQQLKELSLDGTQVTGAGLAHLHQLKQLEKISITHTKTTDGSVSELQKALPGCRIIR
jgi:hypothetical protein